MILTTLHILGGKSPTKNVSDSHVFPGIFFCHKMKICDFSVPWNFSFKFPWFPGLEIFVLNSMISRSWNFYFKMNSMISRSWNLYMKLHDFFSVPWPVWTSLVLSCAIIVVSAERRAQLARTRSRQDLLNTTGSMLREIDLSDSHIDTSDTTASASKPQERVRRPPKTSPAAAAAAEDESQAEQLLARLKEL